MTHENFPPRPHPVSPDDECVRKRVYAAFGGSVRRWRGTSVGPTPAPLSAPPPPAWVSASDDLYDRVVVTWAAVAEADGYGVIGTGFGSQRRRRPTT